MPILLLVAALIFPIELVELGHQGGCRKDSPVDQCCHAGSEPEHCHDRAPAE